MDEMTPMTQAQFPDLKDAGVLVTGGGSGIGASLVEAFAMQGAKVSFIDIAEEPSLALVKRLATTAPHPVHFFKTDLRSMAGCSPTETGQETIRSAKTDFVHTFELLDDRFQRRKFIGAPASIPLVFTLNTEIRPSISQDRSKQARARPANRDNKETPVVVIVHRHNRN